MINLRNDATNAMIGAISEPDLQLLVDAFSADASSDQTYFVNRASLELMGGGGKATDHMLNMLRTAVGSAEGVSVRWKRS